MIRCRLCYALALLLLGGLAQAAGVPRVDGAWIRLLPADLPAGGYFSLHNDGDAAITLDAASSPDYGLVMLHRSLQSQGASRMEMVASVTVPAHGTLRFAPGGYHIMLMKPRRALKVGDTVPVTLKFADGQALTVRFTVRGAAALSR